MNPLQAGTFNTISQNEVQIGGAFPVWARVGKLYQGGGTIDISKFPAGTVIGAGTPVKFNGAGKTVVVFDALPYDSTATYEVGQLVTNNGDIYENKTAITAGESFTSSKWTKKTSEVNGFVFEDVCIPAGCTHATCGVVYDGRIYADRAAGGKGIPANVEANFKNAVEFIRE